MNLHFITGLPRAGSTLLAALLRQNPKYHASIMSPVGSIFTAMITQMSPKNNEAASFITDAQRHDILRGIFQNYYNTQVRNGTTIFDNNRRWTANLGAVARLFPNAVMLACVRDPIAIADSFEHLFQRHPMHASAIYGSVANTTVYQRITEIMRPEGVLGFALDSFRTAFFGPFNDRMLVIEYDQLAQFPQEVMNDIYRAIDEPQFTHDLKSIEPIPGAAEFDASLDTPGLHGLKPIVSYAPRETILPPDLIRSLPKPFWRLNEVETTPG